MWSLGVWWLGEGLGGLFSGMASPITGAPGAAILYALIAVLLRPAPSEADQGPPAARRAASLVAAGPGIGSHGTLVSVLLAVSCAAIGAGVLIPAARWPALAAGIVIALAIWVAGENFGGMFTGRGTDPGTGPLLILLAATCWPRGAQAEPGRERMVRM